MIPMYAFQEYVNRFTFKMDNSITRIEHNSNQEYSGKKKEKQTNKNIILGTLEKRTDKL